MSTRSPAGLSATASSLAKSRWLWLGGVFVVAAALFGHNLSAKAEDAVKIPPPVVDQTGVTGRQTLVLAGGCFWGVQGVFQHVKGVSNAVSGYSGGAAKDADYETVSDGATGHAESVQITYDPKEVSLGHLLQIYFSVVTDPTQLNRQGPDSGTQYRSAIFAANADQAKVAHAYIDQLDKAHVFPAAIVTKVEPFKGFYPAEAYHQNFLTENPTYPYIAINDIPKVEHLASFFTTDYRKDPVLVPAAKS